MNHLGNRKETHLAIASQHFSLLDLKINCNLHVYYINLHYQLTHETGWQKVLSSWRGTRTKHINQRLHTDTDTTTHHQTDTRKTLG